MPHKHTRRGEADATSFNLAPGAIARPLPAFTKATLTQSRSERTTGKRKAKHIAGYGADDTPKAFARLLQIQTNKRSRSGLDDGEARPSKKRAKINAAAETTSVTQPVVNDVPKLLPGEKLSDFAARVNQAIPVAGLARRGKVKVEGVKEQRTRKEKRMHKMYDEWREEDAKMKAREEEAAEQAEEDAEERLAEFNGQDASFPLGKRAKRRRAIGEVGQVNDDPWAVLKKKRQAPRGLHDVAQAPPDLKAPKERFKVKNGAQVSVANVPASAGSLKKREELSEARREVIERYRNMMKGGKD